MMLSCQKHKFSLPEDVSYLNCAYLAPNLLAAQQAGIDKIEQLGRPYSITEEDFFKPVSALRSSFSKLIDCSDPDRIAINTSVSYGIANVIKQLRPTHGSNIVMPLDEFPSNVHAWQRLCNEYECHLNIVSPPEGKQYDAVEWNRALLDAVDDNTSAFAITPLHWSGGSVFHLENLREKCRIKNALFILDGTQCVGVSPLSVSKLQPDALICAGYKWLLSPYGLSFAYYGDFFDEGIPIEENWITHKECNDFKSLVHSHPELLPKGLKYSSGQHPSFIYVAMAQVALDQILAWGVENISDYTKNLRNQLLQQIGHLEPLTMIKKEGYYSSHLFGIWFNERFDLRKLKAKFDELNVYISLRGDAMRISLHVFNDEEDVLKLANCINGSV